MKPLMLVIAVLIYKKAQIKQAYYLCQVAQGQTGNLKIIAVKHKITRDFIDLASINGWPY